MPNPNPEESQRMIDDALREMGFKEDPPELRMQAKYKAMHDRVEQHFRRLILASSNVHFDRMALAHQILPFYRDELKNESKDVLLEMLASYFALRMANRL